MIEDGGKDSTQVIGLPDGSEAEFPASMSDDDVRAAIHRNFGGGQQAPPSKPRSWTDQTARGIVKKVGAPVDKARQSLSYLMKGDLPAAAASGYNAALMAPSAVLAPLDWIPGAKGVIEGGMQTLAKPGVDMWNQAIRPAAEGAMNAMWPNHPTVSPAATKEANELGQNATGALSATAIGEIGGAAGALAGRTIRAGAGALADKLTSAAYKIPPTVKGVVRKDVIGTLQRYGINPTEGGGLPKWQNAMDELEKAQTVLEDNARPTSYRVAMGTWLRSVNEVQKKWVHSDTPKDFQSIISAYKRAVREQHPKGWLGMDDMIAIKRNLQYQLKNVFQKQQSISPTLKETVLQEAKHALEMELKGYLEKMIPDYKEINGEMKALMDAKPFIERATNRLSNYDAVSAVKDMAGAGTGAVLGGAPGAAIGVAAERMLLHPPNWSRAANAMAPQMPAPPLSTSVVRGAHAGGVAGGTAGLAAEPDSTWIDHPDGFSYRIVPEE